VTRLGKFFLIKISYFAYCRAAGGELQAILDEDCSLSEQKTRFCVREVLKALVYLHRRNIAHLDLKPQNILLNTNNLEGSYHKLNYS
jgi:serine/threonine protein kinase